MFKNELFAMPFGHEVEGNKILPGSDMSYLLYRYTGSYWFGAFYILKKRTHHEITDVKMAAKSSKQTFIKSKHIYTRISFNMIVFITKKTQSFRGRDRCLHFFLKLKHNYIDVPKVSGHCDFLLYISCKTTFFKNIIPKSTLFRYWLFFYQQKRERT
jgi:hypothetical protein